MSTYRITIDRSLCSGFGSCVELAPGIFSLDAGGKAAAVVVDTDDPAVLDAADSCPMGAIVVEEVMAA
jgi:ferredoxin